MIQEKIDRNSGAILFKKDPDSKNTEMLYKEVEELKKQIKSMDRRLKKLENPEK